MSIKTIFPNSLPDVEGRIIAHADGSSCLALCQVSKYAQEVLPNDAFKRQFFLHYPHFKIAEKKCFQALYDNHPMSCWKIACDSFCFKKSPISKNKTKLMCFEFFKDEASSLHKLWLSHNDKRVTLIKKICECHNYQNETSPFHAVYQSFESCLAEGVFDDLSATCTNEHAAFLFPMTMEAGEEKKKIEAMMRGLSLISRVGSDLQITKQDLLTLEKFLRREADESYVALFDKHVKYIESDFEMALGYENNLVKRAQLENCLTDITKAVENNFPKDILIAIHSLEKEEMEAVFGDFADDKTAMQTLQTKEGRDAFLEKYEPLLKQYMDHYFKA